MNSRASLHASRAEVLRRTLKYDPQNCNCGREACTAREVPCCLGLVMDDSQPGKYLCPGTDRGSTYEGRKVDVIGGGRARRSPM